MVGSEEASESDQLKRLGRELLGDPAAKLNHIVPLLKAVDAQQAQETAIAAVRGLKVFFIDACEKGDLDAPARAKDGDEAHAVYVEWLRRQYAAFHTHLLQLIAGGAPSAVQVAAVAALLEGVRGREGSGAFDNHLLGATVSTLVGSREAAPDAVNYLITTFLPHADVRFYTLRALGKLASREAVAAGASAAAEDSDEQEGVQQRERRASGAHAGTSTVHGPALARAAYDVLSNIPGTWEATPLTSWCGADAAVPVGGADASQKRRKRKRATAEEGRGAEGDAAETKAAKWASGVLQRRAWSNAWLALLRLPLPRDIFKKVLVRVHADVLPHLAAPHLLTDWLTRAVDAGGLPGMLALHGIFALVTRHGLEYPHFYRRLYGLLTPAALMAKQRARFFELADVFLTSGLVPAYTAAAFAKRFARLALTASPAGAMLAIAFVHNLLRRHPATCVLLHRPAPRQVQPDQAPPASSAAAAAAGATENCAIAAANCEAAGEAGGRREGRAAAALGEDPYLADEEYPAESRAIESSLWEMDTLRNHYAPQVAAFAAVLDKDLGDRVRTAEVDTAPLRGGSYASMVTAELARRLKRVPTAFYAQPPSRLLEPAACAPDFPDWSLAE